ncbi:hypothetical protein [Nocardia sp. NPDC046763]|uniref:hypothetical protein n=1 Tax=Nocardia sp. NPDC046763 TaxID=3155256 RepID=UPI003407180C
MTNPADKPRHRLHRSNGAAFVRPTGVTRHAWIVALLRKFVHDFEEDAATQIAIHKWFLRFWLINFIAVTLVFFLAQGIWLRLSVFYLVAISLYANFATDYDALSASQASLHASEARDAAQHSDTETA